MKHAEGAQVSGFWFFVLFGCFFLVSAVETGGGGTAECLPKKTWDLISREVNRKNWAFILKLCGKLACFVVWVFFP